MSTKQIKILQMTSSSGLGGAEEYVYMITRALLDRGVYVDVACPDSRGELVEKLESIGARVILLPVGTPFDPAALFKLVRLIRREKYDIIHTRMRNINLHVMLASFLAPGPARVITFHGPFNTDAQGNFHGGIAMKIKDRVISALINKRADSVIAISDWVREDAIERGKIRSGKITVIHNAPEESKFELLRTPGEIKTELGIPADRRVIGIIGRPTPEKDWPTLLSAADILLGEGRPLSFVFVGGSPGGRAALGPAALRHNPPEVIFTGARRDTMEILNAFDVFVLVSKWEGFGRVLTEAMALSKPVVASNAGAIPEVVKDGETGLLVPPGDPRALAKALAGLLDSPEEMPRLGRAGRIRYEQYFRETLFVEKTLDIYRKALRSKKTQAGNL